MQNGQKRCDEKRLTIFKPSPIEHLSSWWLRSRSAVGSTISLSTRFLAFLGYSFFSYSSISLIPFVVLRLLGLTGQSPCFLLVLPWCMLVSPFFVSHSHLRREIPVALAIVLFVVGQMWGLPLGVTSTIARSATRAVVPKPILMSWMRGKPKQLPLRNRK